MRIQTLLATGCLLVLGLAPAGASTKPQHGFLDRTYRAADGKVAKYILFVPWDYQGDKPYPLIVFLHGSGEAGSDGRKQAQVGLGPAVRKQEKTFPFLVLFPQAKRSEWEADSPDGRLAMAILDEVMKSYRVDARRVALTGLSSGGDGTWSFAVKYPERWAAIVPLCGEGNPADAPKIKDIPCWYFMGSADNPGDVKIARAMVQALQAAGGKPRYTEYPGLTHYIWEKTYGNPELFSWILEQHRK